MVKTCFFDSNGTLLDTRALDALFTEIFGSSHYRQIWFKTVLHTSLVLNHIDDYQEFTKISDETLAALAKDCGVDISMAQKLAFKETMMTLPLFPDVLPGLQKLQEVGYRLVIFSNGGKPTSVLQMTHAGIADRFEKILSTDGAKAFKPAQAAYAYALEEMNVSADDSWMIAGHAWDIAGAARAGMKTALLMRPEHGDNSCFPKPDCRADHMVALAEALITHDKPLLDRALEKIAHPLGT